MPGWKLPPQAAPEQLRFVFSADVAQLVERVHGKDEVKGSSPFVGSFRAKTSPQFCTIFVCVCPRLSRGQATHRPRPGAKSGVLPSGRAIQGLSHGKEGVSGSSPLLGFPLNRR